MPESYVTAREAAAELNISRATLYAYVSRGLIRSEAQAGGRQRLYSTEDIRRIRAKKTDRTSVSDSLNSALNWGGPVLESEITLIQDGALYYRGRDVVALSASASLETVAGLLWRTDEFDPFDGNPPPSMPAPDAPGIAASIAMLNQAGQTDDRVFNLTPRSVAATGARILRIMSGAFGGQVDVDDAHSALATGWGRPDAAEAIRAALVLCADHELNASTFVVRCVAGTGATPYAAVIAGLNALSGPRHGGMTDRVAALLREVSQFETPRAAIYDRLKRGDPLPGFGHELYPDGDIRGQALMQVLEAEPTGREAFETVRKVTEAVEDLTGQRPNIDFMLEALRLVYRLPDIAPFALFAVGRTVGWIAHAQEQYETGKLIRPRAKYTGETPQTAHSNRAHD